LRKSLKVTLILLGMTAALVGIIATVGVMKSGIDNLLAEGTPMETVGKKEFDEMVEFIDGNFRLTASQVLASASVVSAITGIPLNVAILISGAIVIAYTTLGGMLADAIADILQFFIIFFGLLISILFIIQGAGGWQAVSNMLPQLNWICSRLVSQQSWD